MEHKTFQIAEKIIAGVPPLLPKDLSSEFDVLLDLHTQCIHVNPSQRPTIRQVITKLHFLQCAVAALADKS